jgi:hypothetical protein
MKLWREILGVTELRRIQQVALGFPLPVAIPPTALRSLIILPSTLYCLDTVNVLK